MSEQVLGTIELLQSQIQKQLQEVADKKRVVNSLCPLAGIPPIYADVEADMMATTTIRSDEFYGRPLAEVVRKILEKRKAANLGAASVQEIFDTMKAGGFGFEAKNDDYAKRGLYQSLTKNSRVFHKIQSSGKYGLLEWYPNAKQVKAKPIIANGAPSDDDVELTTDDFEPDEALSEEGSESAATEEAVTAKKKAAVEPLGSSRAANTLAP